jgi:aminoglycoside phosphotransferase (APT) family kinase protein
VFCKYGTDDENGRPNHRHGVAYEAAVYRYLLEGSPLSVPRFYGTYTDQATAQPWLIVEYLDQAMPLNDAPEPETALCQAAQWIGQFHTAGESCLAHAPVPFLASYEPDFYVGWARRTARFTGYLHERYPWLPGLCRHFEELAPRLMAPTTVIHGEFEANNILIADATIYPVDWESAALGVGEIDLASLTWGWDAEIVRQCELAYQRTRWPGGAPADFWPRLAACRLYLHLRWLGDRPDWTAPGNSPVNYDELRTIADQFALLV